MNSTPPLPESDVDTVLSILLREDIDAIRNADTLPAPALDGDA